MHLNYHVLKMVLWEVEGASATPSNLKIQAYSSDAVKALRSFVGKNSSFKIYKTPSARYIVVYLGCRPQGVVF